jgi:phosphatidate cytidylyltransferase
MNDPTNQTPRSGQFGDPNPGESTGVTIIGAQPAGSAAQRGAQIETESRTSSAQWADDDETNDVAATDSGSESLHAVPGQLSFGGSDDDNDADHGGASFVDDGIHDSNDDDDGMDSAWMDAGDTTLGDLLGHQPVAPVVATVPEAVSVPPAVSVSDNEIDDVFPDHMYTNQSLDVTGSVDVTGSEDVAVSGAGGEDTGVILAAAAATLERRERRMSQRAEDSKSDSDPQSDAGSAVLDDAPAPRKRRETDVDNPDGGKWGAFAGSGPRWRDEAKDWADVDAADTAFLGDDDSRIGTLDAKRSERSDLYAIDGDGDDDSSPEPSGKPKPTNVLRFDSLVREVEPEARIASGGPQQRVDRRKSTRVLGEKSTDGFKPSAGPVGTGEAKSSKGRPAPVQQGRAPQSGLSARIGTGVLLLLVVALVFIFGKAVGASILAAIAITMASLELMHALRERGFKPAIPAVAVGLLSIVGGAMWRGERGVMVAIVLSVAAIACWYLFGAERERPAVNMAASFLSFGYPAIAAATAALLLHAPNGVGLLMPAIVCTVANDVFAYAGGRLIGRTHFSDISPNKTVEGLVVGMLGSVGAAAAVFGKLTVTPWTGYTQAIVLGVAIGIAAPIGDLVESMLKRDLNVKDMGKLLPGHGGVFDRIDAMMLAVPATWLIAVACGYV